MFLILLLLGVVPRVRNHRELTVAAQKAQNTVPQVYVIRPEPASEADLSLAATTQAIQDAIIYARTSGYLRKRYVDIGDQVTAGQLLAEIESPEIDQQLRQAQADLQQSEKNLDLQKANLDLARVTMERLPGGRRGRGGRQAGGRSERLCSPHGPSRRGRSRGDCRVKQSQRPAVPGADIVRARPRPVQRHGDPAERGCGRVDHGRQPHQSTPPWRRPASPARANGLFEVAQIDALRVFVNVPQAYGPNVKVGLPVQVTVRGQLMQPVTGTVTRTANALDPGTRTLLTQVDIPNQVAPAAARNVRLRQLQDRVPRARTGGFRRPRSSSTRKARRVAIVGPGNKLHFQEVALGRDFGTSIDIQAGLQRQRNDREPAHGVSSGGSTCQPYRISKRRLEAKSRGVRLRAVCSAGFAFVTALVGL